jgi:hypothetical protein
VEQFESARYNREGYDDEEPPVQFPSRRRRDIDSMDMYPRKRREDDLYDDEQYDEEQAPPRGPVRSRYGRRRSSLGTVAFIVITVLLVLGATLYTYVFDSATITVVPKYKDVSNIGKPFLFSLNGTDPAAIPYSVQTVSLSESKTLTPSESRRVEAKASGRITVYNNYDSSPQKLIKNTRFESAKGKIYRINQSVEVPGKKGGTPGSIEVVVYADSTGADYNVDNTTFTIPGFKGTARESAFYAKSKGPIAGGSSGSMSLPSVADINAAKDSLAIELGKSIQNEMLKINKAGYIPMYSAAEITYEDNEDEILKGSGTTYKVTAIAHLMLADASKLAEAIAKTFGDYDGDSVRLTYTDTLSFTKKEADHVTSTSTLSILIEGKPRVVWQSDSDKIKDLVKGNKRDEFKPLMKTINSIESAEISFSPLWLSRFPSEVSRIFVIESLPKR